MAYAMRFMAEVEKGDCMTVQHQLLSGYTHANVCYLGVYPLHLAIELGDHDMCVLLLYAGAKTDLKPNGKDKKTALEMATEYSKDKKHKFNKLEKKADGVPATSVAPQTMMISKLIGAGGLVLLLACNLMGSSKQKGVAPQAQADDAV